MTDIHYGASPVNRIDDYNQSILSKIEHVFKLARKHSCYVLIGGDLFDSPKIKIIDLTKIFDLFAKYRDLKIFCLRGNEGHDGLRGSSPLDLLQTSGLIQEQFDSYDTDSGVRLIFCDHGKDLFKMDGYFNPNKFNVMLTHTSIVRESVIFDHIMADDIKIKSQMILVAHYHPYQGIFKNRHGNIFLAPGALARRKKTKHDLERSPKCVYFAIVQGKLSGMKEIAIPCNKNVWNEGSTLESLEEVWYDNKVINEVATMKEIIDGDEPFMTLEDCLNKYADQLGAEPQVLEYCLNKLGGM